MPIFEYKFELNLDGEAQLNEIGEAGWELIAVSQTGKDISYTGFWFKRQKQQ